MSWQRPLTGFERWMWMFHQASPLNVVMPARLIGDVDPDRLRSALADVCRRHPHLHARIDDQRAPRFIALPVHDPEPRLEVAPWREDAWRETVVDGVNHDFDWRRGPLLYAHLLRGDETSDLIVCFNHTVVDGHAAAVVVEELLLRYGGATESVEPGPDDLDPPVRRLFSSRWRAWSTAMRMMRQQRHMTPLPLDGQAALAARRTHLIDAWLSEEETEALVAAARAHETTAHGAILAAMLMAGADEIRTAGAAPDGAIELGCGSPIDLRRHCGLDHQLVGNFVSGAGSVHAVSPDTSFWTLAAEAQASLRAAIDSGEASALTRFQHDAARLLGAERAAKMIVAGEKKGRAAVLVTNLGRVGAAGRYGDVELQRLGMMVSANTVSGALLLGVATAAGRMWLGFTYCEPLIAHERAERMVAATVELLRNVA